MFICYYNSSSQASLFAWCVTSKHTCKFNEENWYKVCYKAQPKQVSGPVKQHSPTVVSSLFPFLPKGQKVFLGKLSGQIGVSLCSLPNPCNGDWSAVSNRPNPHWKHLLLPRCLVCLFVLHLAPCISFLCLPSAACRMFILFSKPWSNLTFSAMRAAFRFFCFWNWYSFSSHISLFPLDFLPLPTSIGPWMTSVDPRRPQSLWCLEREPPICRDHKPSPPLETQTYIAGRQSLLSLQGGQQTHHIT